MTTRRKKDDTPLSDETRLRYLTVEMGLFEGWIRWGHGVASGVLPPAPGAPASMEQIADHLRTILTTAYDDSLCMDDCKGMYFCEKKKGHRGRHTCANGGLSW